MEYEDIRDVVLAVGSCAGFWDVCVLRLSWHVHKFASSLRPIARGMFVCLFFCFFASVIAVPLWKPVIKGYYFVLVVSCLCTENQFSAINFEKNLIHVWSWSMSFIDRLFSSFFYFVLTFSYVIAAPLWKPVTNRYYRFSHVKLVHLETGFLLFGRTSIQICRFVENRMAQ